MPVVHPARLSPAKAGAYRWRRAVLIGAPLLGALGLTHAAWRAVADHRRLAGPIGRSVADKPVLYAAIPPLAPSPAKRELAAPARGVTGTVLPPPEPVGWTTAEEPAGTTVFAARPFNLGHAAALDRGRALECLTAAIYHEAGNQGDDGERAVAQVVLNRVRHPAFPSSVCGVVYQGSEHAGCQFSFACDGSAERAPSRAGWLRAMRVATDALAGQVFTPVGLATHYHTYAVTPAWNRALVMTDAVGAHFFHRWKGYWGTPAAFSQSWSGHEPEPGPHAALSQRAEPAPALTPPPGAEPPMAAATETAQSPLTADANLPESEVLDRWKDSGKPLR